MKNDHTSIRKMTMLVLWSVAFIACGNILPHGRPCSVIEGDARALKDRYKQCSQGDGCIFVNMYEYAGSNNCLGAFQCSTALRAGSDLEAFRKEARALAEDYKDCNTCVQAGCVNDDFYEAFCNIEIGKCDMRPKTAGSGQLGEK